MTEKEKTEPVVKKETTKPIEETSKVTLTQEQFNELLNKASKSTASAGNIYPPKSVPNRPDHKETYDNKYSKEDKEYFRRMGCYEGYPRIIGGRVEDSGKKYENDDTYKEILNGNAPRCLCGQAHSLDTIKDLKLMFVPFKRLWLCNAGNCEQSYYRAFQGFERLVSQQIFESPIPKYGAMLPDRDYDPCVRRGIHPLSDDE